MEVRHGGAFGGSPLDRMNQKRGDPAFLRECLEAPAIRVMAVDASKRILVRLAPSAALGWLDRDSLSELPIDLADPSTLLLGSQNGVVYFAARVLCDDPEALPGGEKSFRSLRSLVAELPEEDAAIAAHAISLCYFHDRHRFCGSCGAATTPEQGGTRLRCRRNLRGESTAVLHGGGRDGHDDGSCSGVWFPRIDCVSIMLVVSSDGNRCLMGRASRFRSKMWSCLAVRLPADAMSGDSNRPLADPRPTPLPAGISRARGAN
jgi:NAD+ diphosphatase